MDQVKDIVRKVPGGWEHSCIRSKIRPGKTHAAAVLFEQLKRDSAIILRSSEIGVYETIIQLERNHAGEPFSLLEQAERDMNILRHISDIAGIVVSDTTVKMENYALYFKERSSRSSAPSTLGIQHRHFTPKAIPVPEPVKEVVKDGESDKENKDPKEVTQTTDDSGKVEEGGTKTGSTSEEVVP